MAGHDPLTFVNSLSAKLATRSRHVCVLLGAGAARACGLPDIGGLTTAVEASLPKEEAAALASLLKDRNLEDVLSRLRRIHALIDETDQKVDGLTAAEALTLDRAVCAEIVAQLDIGSADLKPMLKFAAWIARADYHLPVEIFTLNYDLLTETALERLRTPYFDGFVGTFSGAFLTDLVEATPSDGDAWLPPFIARLWKLHGSVSWQWSNNDVIRLGQTVGSSDAAAIFPSDMKYDQSRRVPFVVLHDRLRRALRHPETLTIITGYSWSDEHLNEVIFDAARHRPRSEIVAFSRSSLPDVLVEHAREIPNLQAVTGAEAVLSGVRADWKSAGNTPPDDVWDDNKLALREFGPLAEFLARSSPPQRELEARAGGGARRGGWRRQCLSATRRASGGYVTSSARRSRWRWIPISRASPRSTPVAFSSLDRSARLCGFHRVLSSFSAR